MPSVIRVGGKTYTAPDGANLTVNNNAVFVNGVRVYPDGDGPLPPGPPVIVGVEVTGGDTVGTLSCDGNATVHGTVDGYLRADGNVHCGAVGREVTADGNVTCGNVQGNVTADGNVMCGSIGGNVKAGGNVIGGRR